MITMITWRRWMIAVKKMNYRLITGNNGNINRFFASDTSDDYNGSGSGSGSGFGFGSGSGSGFGFGSGSGFGSESGSESGSVPESGRGSESGSVPESGRGSGSVSQSRSEFESGFGNINRFFAIDTCDDDNDDRSRSESGSGSGSGRGSGSSGSAGYNRSGSPGSAGSSQPVRVRFAPSPTGLVHIGGLRTIAYNYLFARSQGGRFVLRIEDTDRDRSVPGAAESLESTLTWLGMEPDEGPGKGGPFGPYVQSQRLHYYKEAADHLLQRGRAYRCFCTADRLMIMKKEQLKNRESVRYDNRCRSLTPDQISANLRAGLPFAIRLHLASRAYPHMDLVYGLYEYRVDQHEGDPVIVKADGYPTYHLANVIDDHRMMISHVIRGEEWLQSTPKHLQLYDALGLEPPPKFAHLPLLMGHKREKLSKRDASANLDSYRRSGYFPLALINFVLSTGGGFDHGKKPDGGGGKDKNRLYPIDELIDMFDLTKLSTRSTKIEPDYLKRYNREYMKSHCPRSDLLAEFRRLISDRLKESIEGRCENRGEDLLDDDRYLTRILDLYLADERTTTLAELIDNPDNAFLWTYEVDVSVDQKNSQLLADKLADMIPILEKLIDKLSTTESEEIDDCSIDDFKRFLDQFKQESGMTDRLLMPYLRLLITNRTRGLPIAEMFYLLGRKRLIRRLKSAIDRVKKLSIPPAADNYNSDHHDQSTIAAK